MRHGIFALLLAGCWSSPKVEQPKPTNPVAATAPAPTVIAPAKESFYRLNQITDANAKELWNEMAEDLHLNPKDGWKLPTSTKEIVRDIEGNGGCYCDVLKRNWRKNGESTITVGKCRSIKTDPDGSIWWVEDSPYEQDNGIAEINYSTVSCERTMRGEDDYDE